MSFVLLYYFDCQRSIMHTNVYTYVVCVYVFRFSVAITNCKVIGRDLNSILMGTKIYQKYASACDAKDTLKCSRTRGLYVMSKRCYFLAWQDQWDLTFTKSIPNLQWLCSQTTQRTIKIPTIPWSIAAQILFILDKISYHIAVDFYLDFWE